LGAIKGFLDRNKIGLLEWIPSEKILYILEPSFLFYLRWREGRASEEKNASFAHISYRSRRSRKNHLKELQWNLFHFDKDE
jgi:hypothetical protein